MADSTQTETWEKNQFFPPHQHYNETTLNKAMVFEDLLYMIYFLYQTKRFYTGIKSLAFSNNAKLFPAV